MFAKKLISSSCRAHFFLTIPLLRSKLGCALTFALEAKFEIEAKILFRFKAKKSLISHDSLRWKKAKKIKKSEKSEKKRKRRKNRLEFCFALFRCKAKILNRSEAKNLNRKKQKKRTKKQKNASKRLTPQSRIWIKIG